MAADNGFKVVQFSPELIQALTQMGELRTRINDYTVEEFKNYKGEEKLDRRNFVEMMNLPPEKSEKEQKEYVRNFVRNYTSGDPQLRKKCLDDIYSRDDNFNPVSLDLSCLRGTDTGPRKPGGLTGSEEDLMSLIGAFRREQALSVKLKENPGCAQGRYGSDSRKRAEFEARRMAMMNGLVSYTNNMPRDNGFNERLHRGNVVPMVGGGEYVAAGLAVNLYRNSMDRLQGGRTGENRLSFSLEPGNGNIYGLSRQLAVGNLTNQMKANAAAAFDTSLTALYHSGLPATTMNEMGVDALDLIHVDGLSVRERYGNKYTNLSEWEQSRMIKAEVMGAIMGGQHVGAVALGPGARGRMQAVTHTLGANLHAYDRIEKRSECSGFRRLFDWGPGKIRTKADNVDRKNRKDRQMEERTGLITNSIAPRLEARESKQYLMENLGMSPKPVTPQVQRQEEKLRGIGGRIGDIEKQNFSSYEEIGNISQELERRRVYEGTRERFNKAKSKLDTTKAVMDNGNLLEVGIREVMDPIIPDYGPGQKEKLGNSYDNDFLPGYYKLNEVRTARGLNQEKLETRRGRFNASLDRGQKKNEYRLEAVNRLLDAKTPEEREKVIGDTLEELEKGAQAHLEQCEDTLNSHPCGKMSPEQIQGKEKRLQVLEGGFTPVPKELLQERAMEEARLNQFREMNREDRTPQIKKFNQAELLHPDYIPPVTKEETLARIDELDAKYGPEMQYLDRREMVKNFRAQDLSAIGETKPYWTKEQTAMTLRYMDSIPIDTSGLSDKVKQTLAEGRTAMEAIAGAKAGTVSLAGNNTKGIGVSIAYEEALKTDPACAKAVVKGVEYAESFNAQWEMRQLLVDDLKELVKKEPVKNMKAEAEKSGLKKVGAEKAGAEKAEAEKAGAGKVEKEKSGPEKAEVEKAGPEKPGGAKGKTEVTFVELELSEKEAKVAGTAAKPQSPWERHDLSPFHKESSRSFQKESDIGSHRQDNKKPAKQKLERTMTIRGSNRMKAGKLMAGFYLIVLLTTAAAVTSMAAPGTSGDWRREQDGRWYYYDEGETMCTGWIKVGGKHYYLYGDGHCAMNEITPDGFRVDADGAWYEAKRELLGQEFPLPTGSQNSINLGGGWGGAQAVLNGAAGKISADSGGKRKLLIGSTTIKYKLAVKSVEDDARYMGLYKDSITGGYRLDIFILLDRNSEAQSLGEAPDYEIFKAVLTTVSSTLDQLGEAAYSSWQGDNSWNISRAVITSVGDCSVIYEAGQGYGRYYLRPSGQYC